MIMSLKYINLIVLVLFIINESNCGTTDTFRPENLYNIARFFSSNDISSLSRSDPTPVTTITPPIPVPECGRKMIRHNALIVGGQNTKPGDWPWHAAIYKLSRRRQSNYICGGSLLSETRILTAGHCVVENDALVLPERLYAILGKHELVGGSGNIQEKKVYEIIRHPDFESNPLKNDIAMLKLSSAVTYTSYIQPVCLFTSVDGYTKDSLYGKYGNVVGWGFTADDELANELKTASLPVASDLSCLQSNPNFFGTYLTKNTFCVGENNGINACNGDSGGGYFFAEQISGQEVWYIRGIISLSVSRIDLPLCNPKEYTLFTDVSQYMSFINENL